MNLIGKLGVSLFTAISVIAISLVAFSCSSFLISTPLQDVPFGFLLAGGVIGFCYLLNHLFVKPDTSRGSTTFSLVSIILRFAIQVVVMVLIGLMYYRWNIKLFNIFVYVAIYTVGVIIFALAHIYIKKKGEL